MPNPKRLRSARGPRRPQYLDSRGADRAVMMILALASEVSALRDRLDTHERLAAAGQVATPAAIEAYRVGPEIEDVRTRARLQMIDRVTRPLLEEGRPATAHVAETSHA